MRNTIFSYKSDIRNSFLALFMWSEVKVNLVMVNYRSVKSINTQCIIRIDLNDFINEIKLRL